MNTNDFLNEMFFFLAARVGKRKTIKSSHEL